MAKWEVKKLGELVSINPENLSPSNFEDGIHYIDISSVDKGKLEKYTYYSNIIEAPSRARRIIKKNDTIFSTVRPNLKAYYFVKQCPKNAICSTGFAVLRSKKNIDFRFLYYLVIQESFVGYLSMVAKGANYPAVDTNDFASAQVTIPDLPTQKRIADILSAYDDLIENNNKRIELLEKSAQELYKEWFVRFRFPNFQNTKFVNGLPEGWGIIKISDIANLKSGFPFKSTDWQDSGTPVVKIKNIQNNKIDLNDISYVSCEVAEKSKNFFVEGGDILIALTGATIGKIGLVPNCKLVSVNQRVGKFFIGKKPYQQVAFLYCMFLQPHFQDQILSIANSSTAQPNISPSDIENMKFKAHKQLIKTFNIYIENHIKQILRLMDQNQNLIKQRDLLLPRLLSGKLEV